MKYRPRIIEAEIAEYLKLMGFLVVRGPKACGKTVTSEVFAKSILQVDIDPTVALMMDNDPKELLKGDVPRLLDEYQVQPLLWNLVRHEVDRRAKSGQFILTGSATPNDNIKQHTGAGRAAYINMRTLSWYELGRSSGQISLSQILKGKKLPLVLSEISYNNIIDRMMVGGWPLNIGKSVRQSAKQNRAYVANIEQKDLSAVSEKRRDPSKVRALLKSYARNTATNASIETLTKDAKQDSASFDRGTTEAYIADLQRIDAIEDLPVFNASIRSSVSLQKTAKRHFTDVSLAVAALGLSAARLAADTKTVGLFFESMAIHDLRVYAQANETEVAYYRDSAGGEIDAIVYTRAGDWAGFEIKLGGEAEINQAAQNLLKLSKNVAQAPVALNVITGVGGKSYTRPDGVNIVSLAALGV